METLVIREPEKTYFTSDLHFGHSNIIKFCNRPFNDVGHMDKTMIENWNSKIKEDDTVYILGDFCMHYGRKSWYWYMSQLTGNKILIQGNHDKDKSIPQDLLKAYYYGYVNVDVKDPETKENSQRITLCHFPMLSWLHSHKGSWQLYGHWHNKTIISPDDEKEKYEGKQELMDYVKEEHILMDRVRPTQYDVGQDGNNFTPLSYFEIKKIIQRNLASAK